MPKTFAQYAAQRGQDMTAEEATAARVFDAAYSLGAALSGARKARRLTQAQLAELSGVTQADISRIERGQIAPTTQTLLRLIEALHGQLTLVVPDSSSGEGARADRLVALSVV